MLKYVDTRVTFAEVPDEISLCINLSNCPHKCRGCHSPYLQKDTGIPLTESLLDAMINEHKGITCVCFMGGDSDVVKLYHFARIVHEKYELKTAWYSGMAFTPKPQMAKYFDVIKVGPYMEEKGKKKKKTTNQVFYAREGNTYKNVTYKFWKETEN